MLLQDICRSTACTQTGLQVRPLHSRTLATDGLGNLIDPSAYIAFGYTHTIPRAFPPPFPPTCAWSGLAAAPTPRAPRRLVPTHVDRLRPAAPPRAIPHLGIRTQVDIERKV